MSDKNEKLAQLYPIILGISELPQLIKDLEGEIIPYNITKRINQMMDRWSLLLSDYARNARDELEKMGYP